MVGATVQQVPDLSTLMAEGDEKVSKWMNNIMALEKGEDAVIIMGGAFKRESREKKEEETIPLLSNTKRARRKDLEHYFHDLKIIVREASHSWQKKKR